MRLAVTILLALATMFAGCSEGDRSELVGRYEPRSDTETTSTESPGLSLEDDSWRTYCTAIRSPTPIVSRWRENEVMLDGEPTSGSLEWDEAEEVLLPLQLPWGHSERYQPCDAYMLASFMNDETWLYGRYFVSGDMPIDPGDGGGIMLFRGHSCCGIDSDIGSTIVAPMGESTWDGHGWDTFGEWRSDVDASELGTIDIEGVSAPGVSGYWFEWRKRLDSGDPYDWVLEPGQAVGDRYTEAGTVFLVNFWDDSELLSRQHPLTISFATEP